MEIYELLDMQDCPLCEGPAMLEEEDNNVFYINCLDCGCHTVGIRYHDESDRLRAAQTVADLWNIGKVISSAPGE